MPRSARLVPEQGRLCQCAEFPDPALPVPHGILRYASLKVQVSNVQKVTSSDSSPYKIYIKVWPGQVDRLKTADLKLVNYE